METWCQLLVNFTQDSFRVPKLLSGPTPTDTGSMSWKWGGFRPNWKGTFKLGWLKVKKEPTMREPREACSRQRESEVKVWIIQSCPTLCNPVDCRLSVSSVHGILQVRILEWVAIAFYRGSVWPRVSCTVGRFFTIWTTRQVGPGRGTVSENTLVQGFQEGERRLPYLKHREPKKEVSVGLGGGPEPWERILTLFQLWWKHTKVFNRGLAWADLPGERLLEDKNGERVDS